MRAITSSTCHLNGNIVISHSLHLIVAVHMKRVAPPLGGAVDRKGIHESLLITWKTRSSTINVAELSYL